LEGEEGTNDVEICHVLAQPSEVADLTRDKTLKQQACLEKKILDERERMKMIIIICVRRERIMIILLR
jgi:hypothetical protein